MDRFVQEQPPSKNCEVGANRNRLLQLWNWEQNELRGLNGTHIEARRAQPHLLRVAQWNINYYRWGQSVDAIMEEAKALEADVFLTMEGDNLTAHPSDEGLQTTRRRPDDLELMRERWGGDLGLVHSTVPATIEWIKSQKYPDSGADSETATSWSSAPGSQSSRGGPLPNFTHSWLNGIYSRFPIVSVHHHKLSSDPYNDMRYCVEAVIRVPVGDGGPEDYRDFRVGGVHLDPFDESGRVRQKELRNMVGGFNYVTQLGKERQSYVPPCVVMGDFNALRRQDYDHEGWSAIKRHDAGREVVPTPAAIAWLEEQGYTEAFQAAGVRIPTVTCWSGRRVDYCFLPEGCPWRLAGCYVHHTNTSDHIPTICDFDLESPIHRRRQTPPCPRPPPEKENKGEKYRLS